MRSVWIHRLLEPITAGQGDRQTTSSGRELLMPVKAAQFYRVSLHSGCLLGDNVSSWNTPTQLSVRNHFQKGLNPFVAFKT